MQRLLLYILLGLLTSPSPVFALNILGISTVTSSSHHIWFAELMRGLARNGHQIYALAMEPTKIEGAENRSRSIVFENVIDDFHDGDYFDPSEWSELGPIGIAWFLHGMSNAICEVQIRTQGAKEALELVKKTKIDVIVQDLTASQCFYGLWEVAQGNPVMVGFTPFGSPNWVKEVVGGHNWAAIKHFPFAHSAPPYTLWERTLNFVYFEMEDLFRRYYFMPIQQEITEKYIGQKMSTSIHDLEKRISFVLTNSYATLDQGTFLPPDAIEVGGLHVRDPEPLPEEIKEFLDGAEHGAIVMSLGSQIQFSTLAPEKLEAIMAVLRQLKQRVLWKFESNDLKDKPENVMIKKWLPQSDVLAHPKVRVLWTHAGLLSIQEAVWRGVPVVGMPFFVDQHYNIDLLVKKGVGLHLDFESLSEKSILQVLDRILTDRSFALRMKKLSVEYRDRPMSPLDQAVWHVEYASRHPRGPLASQARKISVMELNLVDVYAVLGAAFISIFLVFWILISAFVSLFWPRKKTKTA